LRKTNIEIFLHLTYLFLIHVSHFSLESATSKIQKPDDYLSKWCTLEGDAITLDMLIGDVNYLGKGLSHILIKDFLTAQFPKVSEVLIDPEATNTRAIHIYKKASFEMVSEFTPPHSPNPHYMMRLNMKTLLKK
jgi:hypothetical protein